MGSVSLVLRSDLGSAQDGSQACGLSVGEAPSFLPGICTPKDLVIEGDRIYCLTSLSHMFTSVAGEVRF